MTACPKCGGTKGFEFKVKVDMQGHWGADDSESCGNSRAVATKSVTCLDCGARVNRKLAEGRS